MDKQKRFEVAAKALAEARELNRGRNAHTVEGSVMHGHSQH